MPVRAAAGPAGSGERESLAPVAREDSRYEMHATRVAAGPSPRAPVKSLPRRLNTSPLRDDRRYGAHERAHTEHHLYRGANRPPPAKPAGHEQAVGGGRAPPEAAEAAAARREGTATGDAELRQEGAERS